MFSLVVEERKVLNSSCCKQETKKTSENTVVGSTQSFPLPYAFSTQLSIVLFKKNFHVVSYCHKKNIKEGDFVLLNDSQCGFFY